MQHYDVTPAETVSGSTVVVEKSELGNMSNATHVPVISDVQLLLTETEELTLAEV